VTHVICITLHTSVKVSYHLTETSLVRGYCLVWLLTVLQALSYDIIVLETWLV